jgi:hypothetical protein
MFMTFHADARRKPWLIALFALLALAGGMALVL